MKTNPFNLDPCKTCGRADVLTNIKMKNEILVWAEYSSTPIPYGSSFNREELIAVYTKIFKPEGRNHE